MSGCALVQKTRMPARRRVLVMDGLDGGAEAGALTRTPGYDVSRVGAPEQSRGGAIGQSRSGV